MKSDQTMVEVESVMAGYTREIDILCGMSLQVGLAEIVTLLGPNGCGKSTLLKTIAGFLIPHTGSIRIGGEDVTRMHVRDKVRSRGLGYVPQTENVFNALSV